MQTSKHIEEVKSLLADASPDDQAGQEQQPPDIPQPLTEVDVYVEPDRITFIPKKSPQEEVVESAPPASPPRKPLYPHIYALSVVYIVLLTSILILQVWLVLNPPIATITIFAKSQQITFNGTLQLGRLIAPISLSQSLTVPTTGKGHQDAKKATGYITFYNGQLQKVTISAGTVLTGSDGVQVATDETAYLPAADSTATPPVFGHVRVSAHAINTGASGNIRSYDINETCCSTSVVAKNLFSFSGGADERDFRIVTANDISVAAAALKTTLSESMQAALQAQLESGEALVPPSCTSTVTFDHRAGEEAAVLMVTGTQTCSTVAYNLLELRGTATGLLTRQAVQALGDGYSLVGDVQLTVTQATANNTKPVAVSFASQGTWVYGLDTATQEHIKSLIAGKTRQEAIYILSSLPGIERASINWDKTLLPKDKAFIHLVIFVN